MRSITHLKYTIIIGIYKPFDFFRSSIFEMQTLQPKKKEREGENLEEFDKVD